MARAARSRGAMRGREAPTGCVEASGRGTTMARVNARAMSDV